MHVYYNTALNRVCSCTYLGGVAVFESLVPAQTLELEVEVKDVDRVGEIDVGVAPIVPCL